VAGYFHTKRMGMVFGFCFRMPAQALVRFFSNSVNASFRYLVADPRVGRVLLFICLP
jgi:hypothetical protein